MFKSEKQKAEKNMLTGFVEQAHFNRFHFDRAIRSYDTLGYAQDPSSSAINKFVGDAKKAAENEGVSLFESAKTGGEKRKRAANFNAGDLENYTGHFKKNFLKYFKGPWARFVDEKAIAKPDPELQKEMNEIVRKRKLKSRAGRKAAEDEKHLVEENTILHSNFFKTF